MNATTFTIYREYLEKTGDPSAAASLTLADTLRSSLDAKAAPPAGAVLNIKQAATYLGYSSDGLGKIVNRTRYWTLNTSQITGIINELYDAMQKGKDRVALKLISDRLLQYTLAHFTHEEQVMQEHEYPDRVQHTALHDKIRQRTRDLQEHAHLVTGHDMLHFLKEWWVGHIQGLDKKYTPYLELAGSHR